MVVNCSILGKYLTWLGNTTRYSPFFNNPIHCSPVVKYQFRNALQRCQKKLILLVRIAMFIPDKNEANMNGNRLNAHLPWILLMILITIQSSMSGFKMPPLGLQIEDKLMHFFVFGILGWLLMRGMSLETQPWLHKKRVLVTLVIAILFAISDEWHQSLNLQRDADILDLLADILGIFYFTYLFKRKQNKMRAVNSH
ncbi:VanZ family protein [Calditrichota bacterium GD2]